MGCGASKPIDLSVVDGGMTSTLGMISTEQLGFMLKQKMFSWSSNDFDIKDHNGSVLLKVMGNALSIRDKMHISDATGNKVAVLQQVILSLRSTFYIYSYAPNFEGQPSTEKDKDGELLYRHAFVQDQIATMLGRQIIKKFVSSNEQDEAVGAFEIFVQLAFKFKCNVKTYATPEEKKAGKEQVVIATAGQTSFFQLDFATQLGIEVAKGCDVILILLGMIASEKIKEEQDKS